MSRKNESSKAGGGLIPDTPEPPRPYTPPPGPPGRPIKPIEMAGLAGIALAILLVIGWLVAVPAAGTQGYYSKLIAGDPFHQPQPAGYATDVAGH